MDNSMMRTLLNKLLFKIDEQLFSHATTDQIGSAQRIYVSRGRVKTTKPSPAHPLEDSMKILAIDLGKFNSVACSFDTTAHQSEFETIATQR